MAKVSLRPITPENLDECISLKVATHQKEFIDSNIYSLARAAVSFKVSDSSRIGLANFLLKSP